MTFNKAENLFVKSRQWGFPGIYAELERIGIENVMSQMTDTHYKIIIGHMYDQQPSSALKILSNFPKEN